ncbi:zinc-binding dehydrogenase [Streptomyces cyaneofuscatus]|nr:zinc-binding dehydrogenase [Streptomyces cyaneofuscatus]WOP07037.1 zinc-binding dehydrogenase [Streptomyces cyaneofuscatus]
MAVSATGTWQDYLNVPASEVIAIPGNLPDDLACQMTINPVTANLLLDDLGLTKGEVLLQTAAASTVGRMITALARRRGIRCIGLVRRPRPGPKPSDSDTLQVLTDTSEEARERVAAFAGAQGVAAAIDAVGGATGELALSCLRDGGRMIVYGMLSGTPMPLSPDLLVFHGITVEGFWLPQRLTRLLPEETGELTRRVTDQMTHRHIDAPVSEQYDLSDVTTAVIHAETNPGRGKTLLVS